MLFSIAHFLVVVVIIHSVNKDFVASTDFDDVAGNLLRTSGDEEEPKLETVSLELLGTVRALQYAITASCSLPVGTILLFALYIWCSAFIDKTPSAQKASAECFNVLQSCLLIVLTQFEAIAAIYLMLGVLGLEIPKSDLKLFLNKTLCERHARNSWNKLQVFYTCCGIENANDWIGLCKQSKIPAACRSFSDRLSLPAGCLDSFSDHMRPQLLLSNFTVVLAYLALCIFVGLSLQKSCRLLGKVGKRQLQRNKRKEQGTQVEEETQEPGQGADYTPARDVEASDGCESRRRASRETESTPIC